jgi:Clp amino terminal domain, pathogenicity island component
MTPSPTLQALIDGVKADAPGEEALLQLSQASVTVRDLEQVGDALLGHFVDQCRRSGHSWSEISNALGVSKQAAHKRFTFDTPTFERFTERARGVLSGTEGVARRLGHGFVGTEHILLALLEATDGLAFKVLDGIGISKSVVEEHVLELIKRAPPLEEGKLPFTPRAKAVLRSAVEVSLQLGHNYIGTEHLLLGLFSDEDSVAAKVLLELGASYDITRERTLELLAGYRKD